jgi:hypothetical protein
LKEVFNVKRALTLLLVITLLAALPAARAEAWETAADLFLNQLNDDIRRNDPAAHLYTGSETIPGMYQAFYCPDGCFAMVYADDGESALTGIELFCEDAACVRRRLDDVAFLAYCLGSRDSIEAVSSWCDRWEGFLAERTLNEETGKMGWTHERLVTARNGLNTLIKRGHLFTFLDPELTAEGPLPSMNNRLEGGINAQIRNVLRDHRGMSATRRAKAAFWWCYMHSECPLPAAEILKVMPTDEDIVEVYRQSVYEPQKREGPAEWGDGLVWSELHHSSQWRLDWD